MITQIKMKTSDGIDIRSRWMATSRLSDSLKVIDEHHILLNLGNLTTMFLNPAVVDYCDALSEIERIYRVTVNAIGGLGAEGLESQMSDYIDQWSACLIKVENRIRDIDNINDTMIEKLDNIFFTKDTINLVYTEIRKAIDYAKNDANNKKYLYNNLYSGYEYYADFVGWLWRSIIKFRNIACKVFKIGKIEQYPQKINDNDSEPWMLSNPKRDILPDEAGEDEYPMHVKLSSEGKVQYLEQSAEYNINIRKTLVEEGDICTWKDEQIISGIMDVLMNDLWACMDRGLSIKKCANCGKYFIPKSRSDTKYCDNIFIDSGKKCSQVGARRRFNQKIDDDPLLRERQRFYKDLYAPLHKERKDMTTRQANIKFNQLMVEADLKIDQIKLAPKDQQNQMTEALSVWMDAMRVEYMPRKKAK